MNAPFRNPFIRTALLAGAMTTAYFIGRAHEADLAAAAYAKQTKTRQEQWRLAHTPLALAAIKNLSLEERSRLQLNTVKLGSSTLAMDRGGNFYVDGEDLGKLAKLDPNQALALLAKLPHGKMTSEAYQSFFKQWIAADPDATALITTTATELPQGPEKTSALSAVAVAWAQQDPKAALDWASGLDEANASALGNTLAYVSGSQPALAAQYIQDITNADERNKLILHIAQSWGNANWNTLDRTDTSATLDWLDQVATGATYDAAVNSVFWSYGYINPAAGAALVDKINDPQDRSGAIKTLSLDWAVSKPGAVLDWLQTLPDDDSAIRGTMLATTFTTWSKKNPDAATSYVEGITDPQLFTTLAPALAPAMAKDDPQAALNWVNGFPDSAAKTQAISGVLATMAVNDFTDAWNYAANLPTGTARDGAMDSLVSTLSGTNPAQAATLLGQLGSDAAVLSATTTLAFNWAKSDPAGLSTWINTQPAGNLRDTAVEQYVSIQVGRDPAAAVALANTIADDATRMAYVKDSVLQMAKKDLAAATQAVQTANIAEAQRQNILLLLSQAPGK